MDAEKRGEEKKSGKGGEELEAGVTGPSIYWDSWLCPSFPTSNDCERDALLSC